MRRARPSASPPERAVTLVVIPDRARRFLRPVLCAVLVLALVAVAGVVLRAQPAPAAASAASNATSAVLLSGSSLSYAQGQATAQHLRWEMTVYSLPGAGISRSTLGGGTLLRTAQRVLPELAAPPDVVVLQGGEADHASAPGLVRTETERLLDSVAEQVGPHTRVVLVGPIPGPTVPDSLRVVNDVLAGVAADRGVAYVDAIARGWRAAEAHVPPQLAEQLAAAVRTR